MKSNNSRWIGVPHFFMKFLTHVMLPETVLRQGNVSQSREPVLQCRYHSPAQLVESGVRRDDVGRLWSLADGFHLLVALVQLLEVTVGTLLATTSLAVASLGIRDGEREDAQDGDDQDGPHAGASSRSRLEQRVG